MNIAAIGLDIAQANFNRAAARISAPGNPIDGVSLSSEAVDLIQSKNRFEASLAVVRVTDEMQKTSIDVLA